MVRLDAAGGGSPQDWSEFAGPIDKPLKLWQLVRLLQQVEEIEPDYDVRCSPVTRNLAFYEGDDVVGQIDFLDGEVEWFRPS